MAADLVRSPRKRIILCYITFVPFPLGYKFWSHDHNYGHYMLPPSLSALITVDVFIELIEQLVLDKLISAHYDKSASLHADEAVYLWYSTALGRRISRALLQTKGINIDEEDRSISGLSSLLLETFSRRK